MSRCSISLIGSLAALLGATLATQALAQGARPGDVTTSMSITGLNQFDADLDRGGAFHWGGVLVGASVTRQFTPEFAAGINLRYDYQDWKFDNPVAFGGIAPCRLCSLSADRSPLMSRHSVYSITGLAALIAAVLTPPALAQGAKPGEVTTSVSIAGLNQFDTDLDRGGAFHWGGFQVGANVTRQFTPEFAAGFSLRYDYQDWKWDNPVALGGRVPWSKLNTPVVGLNFSYAIAPDWRLGFNPSVEWSGESGANAGDSVGYGAVLSATRIYSPDLVLGVGAGVFRQIDETKVFPFLVVNWKITDRLRLGNPLQAGPAGGAGLELAYTLSGGWEVGGGGSYRTYRFRLKDDGPVPGGIGENRFIPVFARLSYTLDAATRADFYAAAFVNGKLSVTRADGSDLYSDDYKTAPAIGLTLSHRF